MELRVAGPGGDHGLALLVDPDAAERVGMFLAVGLGSQGDLLEGAAARLELALLLAGHREVQHEDPRHGVRGHLADPRLV